MGAEDAEARAVEVLVARSGLLEATGLPKTGANLLTRTRRFWLGLSDELEADAYEHAVMGEAAANLALQADELGITAKSSEEEVAAIVRQRLLSQPATAELPEIPLDDARAAWPGLEPEQMPGEWLARYGTSWLIEYYPADMRIAFDLAANAPEGCVAVELEVPSPAMMAIAADDAVGRAALARSYALRLSLLVARFALASTPQVKRAVVTAHTRADRSPLLSIDMDKQALDRVSRVVNGAAVADGGWPQDPSVRVEFDLTGWFKTIEPFLSVYDEPVSMTSRMRPPELNDTVLAGPAQAALGCPCACDTGINEVAGRIEAFSKLSSSIGDGTTEELVGALVKVRDNAGDDLSIAEAAERCMAALLDGSVDADDPSTVSELFIEGSALDRAVMRANEMTDVPEGENPHLEEALAVLEEALSPIDALGAYLDDESHVFRYFGSVAERLRFNRDIDDHTRAVKLVPDSYFRAHLLCARFLGSMERYDEATTHALILQRIAPASIDAHLVMVRLLEDQSRTFEAAELLKSCIELSLTGRDAALALYRLAYMEWKLGREDLGVACYQRALKWRTDIAGMAKAEMDDLISSSEELKELSDEEADELLVANSIPLGCEEDDVHVIAMAAVHAIDAELFATARPLLGVLYEMRRDDVLYDLYRGLTLD